MAPKRFTKREIESAQKSSQPQPSVVEEARELFADAGLPFPPVPYELARQFVKRGKWTYASRPLKIWPYNINDYIKEAGRRRIPDYVVLAHAGHGINSYALHYYLVRKPLFLFLQIGWGGGYMDVSETAGQIGRCFNLCAAVVKAAEDAVRKNRWNRRARMMIVASDFYESIVQFDQVSGERRPTEKRLHSPEDALEEAMRLIQSLDILSSTTRTKRKRTR